MATRRRVLVSGIGMVTPIGHDTPTTWNAVLQGKHGITSISHLPEFEGVNCQVAGPLQGFDFDKHPTSFNSKIYSLAMAISEQALRDADLDCHMLTEFEKRRTGIVIAN